MTSAGGVDFAIFRVLDAPRDRVWAALTEPEQMKEWWTPVTFTMIAMNMDFRPGGFFHMGMRSGEGYKMWGKFVYQEIIPLERIVFVNSFSNQAGDITRHPIVPTWPRETKVAVTLEEETGGKTKLNVRWSPHIWRAADSGRGNAPRTRKPYSLACFTGSGPPRWRPE